MLIHPHETYTDLRYSCRKTFHRYVDLPSELRVMVLETAYIYPQRLKVVARYNENQKYRFELIVKTSLRLVPDTGRSELYGIHYWQLGNIAGTLAFRSVGRQFANEATPIFSGSNTFQLHEITPTFENASATTAVAHRWLKYMDRLGLLQHLRQTRYQSGQSHIS